MLWLLRVSNPWLSRPAVLYHKAKSPDGRLGGGRGGINCTTFLPFSWEPGILIDKTSQVTSHPIPRSLGGANTCCTKLLSLVGQWSILLLSQKSGHLQRYSQSRRTERGLEGVLYGGFLWYFRNILNFYDQFQWRIYTNKILFIFIQFSAKFGQIIGFPPPPRHLGLAQRGNLGSVAYAGYRPIFTHLFVYFA